MVPQLRAWHDKYEREGLTIVGVHTPEFFWERGYGKVESAAKELGIRYPVVQDNDSAIWKRYGVRAWPTTILIDKRGIVRYLYIGEGAYKKTETTIQTLLAEGR